MLRLVFTTYRRALSGLPRAVWGLSAVMFVNRAGTMVLPFLSLRLTQDLGYAPGAAGAMIACYGAGGALGAVVGGWLSDRIGPRRVMAGSLLLSVVGMLILGHIRAEAELRLALFLLAVVTESFRPANGAAMASVCPPESHSRGFALQRLALNAGMTIGPAVGGYLAEVDYALLFQVNAAVCLLSAGVLFWQVRPIEPARITPGQPPGTRTSPWRDRAFLGVMALLFVNSLVFFQVFSTLPVYLKEVYRLDVHQVGLLYAVNTVLIIVVEMVLVLWLQRYAKLRVVAIGCVFLGGGVAMLPFGLGFAYAAATVVVWTVGEMMSAPFVASYAAGRAPRGSAGRYMGVFALTFSLAYTLGPAGGLWIYGAWGPDVPWLLSGALCVVIAPPLWWLARR